MSHIGKRKENQYSLTRFQSQEALQGIEKYADIDLAAHTQWEIFAEAGLGVRYTYIGNISKSLSILIYLITV